MCSWFVSVEAATGGQEFEFRIDFPTTVLGILETSESVPELIHPLVDYADRHSIGSSDMLRMTETSVFGDLTDRAKGGRDQFRVITAC